MKIITKKQMLSMPDQTLYHEYTPTIFGNLKIKIGDPDPEAIDFCCDSLTWVKCKSDSHMFEILDDARKNSTSFDMDLECTGRNGDYDDDQLYVVWERKDVAQLIERLFKCMYNPLK